jgi:hypothetical protein
MSNDIKELTNKERAIAGQIPEGKPPVSVFYGVGIFIVFVLLIVSCLPKTAGKNGDDKTVNKENSGSWHRSTPKPITPIDKFIDSKR